MNEMTLLYALLVLLGLATIGLVASTVWIVYDTRRGERHLAEVTYTVGLETRRMMERYDRDSKRMLEDHDLLMRTILERVDRGKGNA